MKRIKPIQLGVFFSHIYHFNLANNNNNNSSDKEKDIYIYRKTTRDMIFDSILVGGIVFIASLPISGIPTVDNIYSALRGFFYYFLAQLIIDRVTFGIAKQIKNDKGEKK